MSLGKLERLAEALDLEIIVRQRPKKAAILSEPVERLGLSVRLTGPGTLTGVR